MAVLQLDALGTHWWIETIAQEIKDDDSAAVTAYISKFENDYSRFRPSSLLGTLNDTKLLLSPPAELIAMLRFGLDMYDQTDGLFNMSVGARLEQLGYGRTSDADARMSDDLAHDIDLSDTSVSLQPHVRLDFGGFGKGWLIDALGRLLQARGYNNFLINGGGDILVRSEEPEEITIEHPYDQTQGIGVVSIKSGSIAASSGQKRTWKQPSGASSHHIIHPASGEPGGTAASVHVAGPTALLADTLSTVMLLATAEQRIRFAKDFDVTYAVIDERLQYYLSPGFPGTMLS
jgi:thiamine biosynthesis lipoprotein